MDISQLLAALDEELTRLRQVRDLLTGDAPVVVKRKRGRPAKVHTTPFAVPTKKRALSEEARQRIAEAQKRRWAAQKRSAQ